MGTIKTVIRKFLWFDITPRKELYAEIETTNALLTEAQEREKKLRSDLSAEKFRADTHEREVNRLTEENRRLQNELDRFYYPDEDCGCSLE